MISTNFVLAVSREIESDPPGRLSETYLAKHLVGVLTRVIQKTSYGFDDDDDWKQRRPTTTVDENEAIPEDAQPVIGYGGSLWLYDCSLWRRVDDDDLTMLCLIYDGKTTTIAKKTVTIAMTARKAANVALLTQKLHMTRRPTFFDNPAPGLAFLDGFWTIDDGVLECVEPHPRHKATFGYDFELDGADDKAVAWLRFLDSLWRDDEDKQQKIDALQEWLGAALIGKGPAFARCALFVGRGGNGKSVLSSILEELFPPETVTTASPAHWDREYTVAGLRRSRFNVCSELPEYKALDTSDTFKAIVAGDRIEGRLPFKEPFSFRCQASHLFAANALPTVGNGDFSLGFFRRFLIFTFNRIFTGGDAGMERRSQGDILDEIRAEHASVLMWALAGACRLLRRREYTLPASHTEALQEWHQDSDPVQDFVTSCCEEQQDGMLLKVLYDDFVTWCEAVGRRKMTNRTLAKRLRQLGIRCWKGHGGTRVGIATKMRSAWLDYC